MPSKPRWQLAREFHIHTRCTQTASRSPTRVGHRCCHRPSAAVPAGQPPKQATHRCAAAFPAVPCPFAQPDFWWPGFRASGLRPALAGKACRSTRTAGRACASEGARAKTGPGLSALAAHPGIDREACGRWAGRGHVQNIRNPPRASCHAEQATKRDQGESHTQTQVRQGRNEPPHIQERSQTERRHQAQGNATFGKRLPQRSQDQG